MINVKKKGNAGENQFSNWLHNGSTIKAYRDSASGGGIRKGDINNNLGYCIEIKTVKALNLKKAWAQSSRDAHLSQAEPLLGIHFDGMGKDKWLIVIDNYHWLDLIKKNEKNNTKEKN
jgi:hypothetical protein